ncbi:hypothetical protein LTR53_010130, partial [Teratosphaeriaceae sp. CCFEE 6253]
MAATLLPHYSLPPRSSTETERRHLLSDSVGPSRAASVDTALTDRDGDGDRTPRARSPAPSLEYAEDRFRIPAGQRRDTIADPSPQPYRGFPSEAHYLAALHAWADQQKYVNPVGTELVGFYGHTSLQEYASRPPLESGLRRKWKARKEAKREKREQQEQ